MSSGVWLVVIAVGGVLSVARWIGMRVLRRSEGRTVGIVRHSLIRGHRVRRHRRCGILAVVLFWFDCGCGNIEITYHLAYAEQKHYQASKEPYVRADLDNSVQ